MSTGYERVIKAYEYVRSQTDFQPKIGVVLGSGLGNYAKQMEVVQEISYDEIPGFPVSTVEGHDGRFLFGYVSGTPVVLMKGRVHYYEGYSMEEVVLPIRLMALLQIQVLLLTNAAGGINPNFRVGDFMIIKDHISSFVPSPLIGRNLDELGDRFPDMSHVYDPSLREVLKATAKEAGIEVQEGVYVQASGPNYETPVEIRMFAALGADAVGMSTTCEAMVARHAKVRVCGISCISNAAAGLSDEELCHSDVQEMANKRGKIFEQYISGIIQHLNTSLD
ncbi:MAG: purine-nucleoside phosphorylase [Lachnospiraceae bacterium]|nr:purine-nucleoside phosphorylase [Lachnospiraceae bacterium]